MEKLITFVFSAHAVGGNATGADEKTSVVDPNGKYRHLNGWNIFDGSIFPTSIVLRFGRLFGHQISG